MNKNGNVLAVVLLVFIVLAIVGLSLFYFITEKTNIDNKIYSTTFLDQMYERQPLIDSYLQSVFDRASKGVNSKNEFIANAKTILKNDKMPVNLFVIEKDKFIYFPEYVQIVSQLDEGNVEIVSNNGKLSNVQINLEIDLKDRLNNEFVQSGWVFSENPQTIFSASYTYKKTFVSTV
jgi:hypothetical protein